MSFCSPIYSSLCNPKPHNPKYLPPSLSVFWLFSHASVSLISLKLSRFSSSVACLSKLFTLSDSYRTVRPMASSATSRWLRPEVSSYPPSIFLQRLDQTVYVTRVERLSSFYNVLDLNLFTHVYVFMYLWICAGLCSVHGRRSCRRDLWVSVDLQYLFLFFFLFLKLICNICINPEVWPLSFISLSLRNIEPGTQ
jgi:hypothetical protein